VHLVGPGAVRVVTRGCEELLERVDGELRRDLAGGMSAHAVGDDVEPVLRQDGEVVLVVGSLTTDVGLTGYFDTQVPLTSFESPRRILDGGALDVKRFPGGAPGARGGAARRKPPYLGASGRQNAHRSGRDRAVFGGPWPK